MGEPLLFTVQRAIPGLYDGLFGGFLLKILSLQLRLLFPLALGIVAIITVAFSPRSPQAAERKTLGLGLLGFTCMTILLHEGWDELFVNLRHSLHLMKYGTFSFNPNGSIEGTVDFLPYFLIGLLGKLGFPLVELALVASWAGGIACCLAARAILWKMVRNSKFRQLTFLAFCFYPPLASNSGSGFSASVFTAIILWAIYCLFISDRFATGKLLLSILPLVRLEGLLVGGLLLGLHWARESKKQRQNTRTKIALALPMLLYWIGPTLFLSVYRYVNFGSVVPTPIKFKAGIHVDLLRMGIVNLLYDLRSTYSLLFVAILFLGIAYQREYDRRSVKEFLSIYVAPWSLICLSIAPYYFSGGDWFPRHWARYMLPVSCFTLILALAVTSESLYRKGNQLRLFAVSLVAILCVHFFIYEWNSGWIALDRLTKPITTPRLQYLSRVGEHLKTTLAKNELVATTEVATIMYFSENPGLDLLGVANPEIAASPLVPEIPSLLLRRQTIDFAGKRRPAIIWPYENFNELTGLTNLTNLAELSETQFNNWRSQANTRFFAQGGLNKIMDDYGYRYITVRYADGFTTSYLVSPESLPDHLERLRKTGFTKIPSIVKRTLTGGENDGR